MRLVGRKPSAFFASTGTFELEMTSLLNDVARDIAASHDWQALTKVHTFAGDGATTAFDKPSDYDRMVHGAGMSDATSWLCGYTRVPDMDTWIAIQNGEFLGIAPGWWILLADQFQFAPALSSGAKAKLPYISSCIVRGKDGLPKSSFEADTDSFVLSERLLTLALIWRWREMKKLDTSDELAAFEKAFAEIAGRDGGSRVIRKGGRAFEHIAPAWPWELG